MSNISIKTDNKLAGQKEFTIDGEYFSNVIIPALYGTIISGLK